MRGGPRPGAGRPARDLDGPTVAARLADVRLPGETGEAFAARLGTNRRNLVRALDKGLTTATLERWIARATIDRRDPE